MYIAKKSKIYAYLTVFLLEKSKLAVSPFPSVCLSVSNACERVFVPISQKNERTDCNTNFIPLFYTCVR